MVENQKGSSSSLMDEDGVDRFPVGMHVLAVDDDRTCLKVLENMLRSCQYHVTTTTNSMKALEMLRKNRKKFDLVISDVKMPDMDGFKLLELVGLEMDLPVIMLSGHRDKELVMKGVIHGACDYLLKPVRIEELQNIWQHVVRKKIDRKDHNKATASVEEASDMVGEGSHGIASENNADQIIKLDKKRKEQIEEEEEDDEENGAEAEDEEPSSQKKPRLIWDAELHRKFVDVVNQLGLENAVPKKILDLMNAEGLTRENVASHLQKFRLGLRKATQQGNQVAAALGGISDPYLQMGSVDGYQDFCTSSGSRRISSTTLPSYASGGIYCGLNSLSGSSLGGIGSSSLVQWRPVQSQNTTNPINIIRNFQHSMFSANQSSSLLPDTPTSLELNRFQQSNCTTGIRQVSPIDNPNGFTVSSGFPDHKPTIGKTNNPLSGLSSNHLLLQGNLPPPTHKSGAFRNHSSLGSSSVNTETFDTGISGSSNMLEYNERWQSAAQLPNFPANSLPLSEVFDSNQLPHNSIMFSSTSHVGNSPVNFSSTSSIAVPLDDAIGELQCQDGLLGNIIQQQRWEDSKQDFSENLSNTFNSANLLGFPNGHSSYLGHSLNQNNTVCSTVDASLVGQMNDARMNLNEACILQQMKSQEGLVQNSFAYLDDIISEMNKQEQKGTLLDHASESL